MGRLERPPDIAATFVGGDEVRQDPQRRQVHWRLHNATRWRRIRQQHPAPERIDQDRIALAKPARDIVPRQPNAANGDADPPPDLDPEHAKQDRQATLALKHQIQHRIVRVVVILNVAEEALASPQHGAKRFDLLKSCLPHAVQDDIAS